jgi:DNA modification methylase
VFDSGKVRLLRGDCLEKLKEIPDGSVDSIVTDPPYELGFMGNGWDKTGIANNLELWRECLRVLKPGGHLLAFSGSRTYHRLTCAIEDAGFDVRDQIMWVYGSGFPKSHNLKGAWQGWGTALKPAHEPICVARKPFMGTVADNVLEHGVGAINIDGCRVPVADKSYVRNCSGDRGHSGTRSEDQEGFTNLHAGGGQANEGGRWPANIIHDGSDEVVSAFPNAKGQQGGLKGHSTARQSPNGIFGKMNPAKDHAARIETVTSAARFFYCAKASKKDREEGLDGFNSVHRVNGNKWTDQDYRVSSGERPRSAESGPRKNIHPTVKPTELMRYLCRLVTPPNGIVLDPFLGSGSTGKAAVLEGFRVIGIELDPTYFEIAEKRINAVLVNQLY